MSHVDVRLAGVTRFAWIGLLLAMWSACSIFRAGGAPIAESPDRIIETLRDRVHRNSQDAMDETDTLVRSLSTAGESALPRIQAALAEPDERFRVALTRALSGIRGDAAALALLDVVALKGSPWLTGTALAGLDNREVRGALSPAQLQGLKTLVSEGSILTAGSAARVLGKCVMVPAQDKLPVIIERFGREVSTPTSIPDDRMSYLSGRVFVLNQFLLGFSHMGSVAAPALQQERKRSAGNAELGKWLTIALGMAGDRSAAHDLEDLLNTEPDRYVRCVAVRAYARSAKRDAIPLLRTLLSDPTRSEHKSGFQRVPPRLIARTAAAELARLEHPERFIDGSLKTAKPEK